MPKATSTATTSIATTTEQPYQPDSPGPIILEDLGYNPDYSTGTASDYTFISCFLATGIFILLLFIFILKKFKK